MTYSSTVLPGGKNVDTRSITIDDGAVVAEGSESIVDVSGSNSEDGGLGSRGGVGSVLGLVTGSDSEEDAG